MAKTFELFNDHLTIEDSRLLDIELRSIVDKLAADGSDEYEKFYHDKLHSIKDVLENSEEKILEIITKKAEKCAGVLTSMGIHTISASSILRRNSLSNFGEVYSDLENWYFAILANEAEKDAYRTARRKNRARWKGYGFDVKGKIAGAAKAGALNLVSGTLHGTANLIGKSFSSMGASLTKSEMFRKPETCLRLSSALFNDIFEWVYFLESEIQAANFDIEIITRQKEHEAYCLWENLNQKGLSPSRLYEMAFQLFETNPTNQIYYSYCLKRFPEQQKNLLQLAQYCHVDIAEDIEAIFEDIFRSMPHKTEQETILIKKKLEEKREELEIESSTTIVKVDKMLHDYDVSARTYRKITFETRELCQKAQKDYQSLKKLCREIASSTAEECVHLKEEIIKHEYVPEISKEFLTEIEHRLIRIEYDESDAQYRRLFEQSEAKNPDLKKYKILVPLGEVVNAVTVILFLGSLALAVYSLFEGIVGAFFIFLVASCLILFVSIRCIFMPWEAMKERIERTMSPELLAAKERKEKAKKAYDDMIVEINQKKQS